MLLIEAAWMPRVPARLLGAPREFRLKAARILNGRFRFLWRPESNQGAPQSRRRRVCGVYRGAFDSCRGGGGVPGRRPEVQLITLGFFLAALFTVTTGRVLFVCVFRVCVFRGSFRLIERLKAETQERNIDFSPPWSGRNSA